MIEAKYVGPHKVPKIGKKFAEDMWQRFLEGGSTHSGQATTLSYFINRCEVEKVSYVLRAHPGMGYYIEPMKNNGLEETPHGQPSPAISDT